MASSVTSPLASSDYPDFLGPILVKELRVGLGSRAVVAGMLGVQVLLSVLTLVRELSPEAQFFSAPSSHRHSANSLVSAGIVDLLYWFIMVVLFHVVLPFRHLWSGDEDAERTNVDLLTLAGQEQKLALSKWLAHGVLSSLVLCSILPYAICRSYCSGGNLTWELATLVWIWVNGMIFSSLGVAVGSYSTVARAFCAVPLLYFFVMIEKWCWLIAGNFGHFVPDLVAWFCAAIIAIPLALILSFATVR